MVSHLVLQSVPSNSSEYLKSDWGDYLGTDTKGGNVNSKPVSVHKSALKVLNQSFSLSDRSADYLVTDKEKAVGMDGTSSLQQIK